MSKIRNIQNKVVVMVARPDRAFHAHFRPGPGPKHFGPNSSLDQNKQSADFFHRTALHLAIILKVSEIAQFLIESDTSKFTLSEQDSFGK